MFLNLLFLNYNQIWIKNPLTSTGWQYILLELLFETEGVLNKLNWIFGKAFDVEIYCMLLWMIIPSQIWYCNKNPLISTSYFYVVLSWQNTICVRFINHFHFITILFNFNSILSIYSDPTYCLMVTSHLFIILRTRQTKRIIHQFDLVESDQIAHWVRKMSSDRADRNFLWK